MTRDPESLRADDRIVWALNLMHVGGYRHVPLVDPQNRPVGVISVKDIVSFLVELFPAAVLNLPPDPHRVPVPTLSGGGEGSLAAPLQPRLGEVELALEPAQHFVAHRPVVPQAQRGVALDAEEVLDRF